MRALGFASLSPRSAWAASKAPAGEEAARQEPTYTGHVAVCRLVCVLAVPLLTSPLAMPFSMEKDLDTIVLILAHLKAPKDRWIRDLCIKVYKKM